MPLQQAAPRLPTTRYHLPSKPRKRMLEIIEQLFGMFAVIGALYASSQMMLVAESSDDMMMFTSLQQAALNVFSYQVLSLLEDAVRMHYQRRRLGADGSEGMLAGAQRGQRTAPTTASDWGDAQYVRRTQFSEAHIYLLLAGLDMLRRDGSSKTYRVDQSDKLYRKRRLNGRFRNGGAKYYYVSAETALLVLLINLARPIAFCDMQASLDGIPSLGSYH